MQNTYVKAQIIRTVVVSVCQNHLTVHENSVQFKFTASKSTNSWFIKQPKSDGHVSDNGASSCTEESYGSPAIKNDKKISRHFLTFGFTYQFVNGEECLLCCMW
jgi:hypothetical protein